MKRNLFITTICCLLLITCKTPSRLYTSESEKELIRQLDSILKEGNLLYKYEKSAWIASDLALKNPIIEAEYNGYFTYEEDGVIKVIILGTAHQTSIAEYIFENNFQIPKSVKIEKRELSDREKMLIYIRKKILENIQSNRYEITVPEGYGLNLVLLPFENKYKLYIITGATKPNVIPFGNDYIFIADQNGNIESWQKTPPRFRTLPEGMRVTEITRTHLTDDPLITATDICTFMLYAPLHGLEAFSVLCRTGLRLRYSLKENTITIGNIFR